LQIQEEEEEDVACWQIVMMTRTQRRPKDMIFAIFVLSKRVKYLGVYEGWLSVVCGCGSAACFGSAPATSLYTTSKTIALPLQVQCRRDEVEWVSSQGSFSCIYSYIQGCVYLFLSINNI
jgi:hypothetical protein